MLSDPEGYDHRKDIWWSLAGIIAMILALALIVAAVVFNIQTTSTSDAAIASNDMTIPVAPSEGEITQSPVMPKETMMIARFGNASPQKVRAWKSEDERVALVARTNPKSGKIEISITDKRGEMFIDWTGESYGAKSLTDVRVFSVKRHDDGEFDGVAQFKFDDVPYVLTASPGSGIIMPNGELVMPSDADDNAT